MFKKSTPVHLAEQVLENINTLMDNAHQAGFPMIFVQHANSNTLVKDSDAWQLHPEIQTFEDEEVIHKLHGSAFKDTNLDEMLNPKILAY